MRKAYETGTDLGEAWVERLHEAFASARFRRLPPKEKQVLYAELAGEITAAVSAARPEWDTTENRDWWAAVLQARFGGNDFWLLSRENKRLHCGQVGQEVSLCAEIVTTQGILSAAGSTQPRSRPSSLSG